MTRRHILARSTRSHHPSLLWHGLFVFAFYFFTQGPVAMSALYGAAAISVVA